MTEPNSSRISGGTVGGIAVGMCAGLLLTLSDLFLWWRRCNKQPGPTSTRFPYLSLTTVLAPFPSTPHHSPPAPSNSSTTSTAFDSTSTGPSLSRPTQTPISVLPRSECSASNSNSSRLLLLRDQEVRGAREGVTTVQVLTHSPRIRYPIFSTTRQTRHRFPRSLVWHYMTTTATSPGWGPPCLPRLIFYGVYHFTSTPRGFGR